MMPLDRKKVIAEVCGVSTLLATFPPVVQAEVRDMIIGMRADPEKYRREVRALNKDRTEYGEATDKIRREELGRVGDGPLMMLLLPLADSGRTLRKLDKMIDVVCSCIMHRRIWDELDRKYGLAPLEFLRDRALGKPE